MSKKEFYGPVNTHLRRSLKGKNKDDRPKKDKNFRDISTTYIKSSILEERKEVTIYQEL